MGLIIMLNDSHIFIYSSIHSFIIHLICTAPTVDHVLLNITAIGWLMFLFILIHPLYSAFRNRDGTCSVKQLFSLQQFHTVSLQALTSSPKCSSHDQGWKTESLLWKYISKHISSFRRIMIDFFFLIECGSFSSAVLDQLFEQKYEFLFFF